MPKPTLSPEDKTRAMALLQAEYQRLGTKAAVADRIGLKRSQVSMVLSGTYPARTDAVLAVAMAKLHRYHCPHLSRDISGAQCAQYALRPCPTTSPREVRHWRACQGCPNRPME